MASETRINKGSQKAHGIEGPTCPRLLPLKAAAQYMGLSLWSLREVIWKGLIPCVKLGPSGRKVFIDVKDIEVFIERNKETIT